MIASILILGVAYLTPKETLKGNATMKTPWQNSLFTVTLMTALQTLVAPHVRGEAASNASAPATAPRSQADEFRIRYGLSLGNDSESAPRASTALNLQRER